MPLEELAEAPADFLHICRQVGTRFAVAELSQRENGDCVYLGEGGCTKRQSSLTADAKLSIQEC